MGPDDDPQDHCHAGDRKDRQPTGVRRTGGGRPGGCTDDDDDQSNRRSRGAARQRGSSATVDDDGERTPSQDLTRSGRGGPIGRVAAKNHGDERSDEKGDDGERDDPTPKHVPAGQHEHDDRPEPVELFLDRQRPVVIERTGRPRQQIGIRLVGAELHPVEDLQRRWNLDRPRGWRSCRPRSDRVVGSDQRGRDECLIKAFAKRDCDGSRGLHILALVIDSIGAAAEDRIPQSAQPIAQVGHACRLATTAHTGHAAKCYRGAMTGTARAASRRSAPDDRRSPSPERPGTFPTPMLDPPSARIRRAHGNAACPG